jgi:tripartite-type tricarboxylate transporter receptor subunit TctC
MARHIAGEPTIVVRNMPGAGSMTSVLYLKDVAPADGASFGIFNAGLLNDSMSEGAKARVKFNQVAWLGSAASDLRVCYAWKTSGIATWNDLVTRKKQTVFGASGLNSNSANGVSMIKNLFNLDLKMIYAYPGNTEMNLAVERGEVEGSCITWSSIPQDWIKNDRINVLARLSPATAPGIPESAKFIGDLLATPEQKSIVDVLVSSGDLARPFILARNTPPDRLKVLRDAFAATMVDPEFLADAARQDLAINAIDGAAAEKIVERLYSFSPEIVAKARDAIKE